MKHLALIIMALAIIGSQCYAQSRNPKTSDKWITTTVDTLSLGTNTLDVYELTITNTSKTDTLKYRSNNEATWFEIFPRQAFHTHLFATKIFRKANKDSLYSQLKAN
jgi:hypothetical protein